MQEASMRKKWRVVNIMQVHCNNKNCKWSKNGQCIAEFITMNVFESIGTYKVIVECSDMEEVN
jgi:hypothetical protein